MGIEYLHKLTDYLLGKDLELFKLIYIALDSVANAVVITNAKGDILWANQAFLDATGYSFAEVLLQNPRILKSGKHNNDFYKGMWDTISSGKVWSGGVYNKYKNGDIHIENMIITPVVNDTEKVVCYIAVKQLEIEKEIK